MSKFTPRDYQHIAIEHLLEHPRSALFAKPGMGKSSSTLAVLDYLYLAGESQPTLVIAPKRVARYTWPKEVKKWDDFNHLEVSPVIGNEKERIHALQRDVPIFTTNYEQIPWMIDYFGGNMPFSIIVPDESTKLKNLRISVRGSKAGPYIHDEKGGSSRATALAKVAFHKNVKRFIELTGTPAANGLKDLWGQIFFLDYGMRLGNCYGAFEARWFERIMRHKNDKFGDLRPKSFAEAEINAKIKDLCLALDPRDWFPDLQEPLYHRVEVDMPKKARDLYRQMEKEMYIEIAANGIEAFTASSVSMKCRQLAAGAIYTNPERTAWAETHDEKLQALEDIFEESGGTPLLVAYQFEHDKERILRTLKNSVDLTTDKGLQRFLAGEADYGLGHPQSMGYGFDGLQDLTNIIVFFSADFNFEAREQMIERVGPVRQLQSGHNRKVHIYDLVAEDTVDEVVMYSLVKKCSVQEAFFEAMKKKRLHII